MWSFAMAIERHVNIEHPLVSLEGMRISWGGIWAGMLVVLGAAARVRSEIDRSEV